MKRLVAAALVALALVASAPPARADERFVLRPGDRVVVCGDSITEQRLYSRYLEQFVYCRYPELGVRFFNAGWGGDTAAGAKARLARDVLELKPTVVTLFFGMNDGGYRAKNDATVKTYRENLTDIVKELKKNGVRVVVFGPGCVDAARNPGLGASHYDEMLEALSKAASDAAKAEGCAFGDVFHPLRDLLADRRKADPACALIPDGVHPDAEGHLVIANAMLRALGADAMRPLGTVDLATGKVAGLKLDSKSDDEVIVTTTGAVAMPFWFDPAHLRTMRESGFLEDLAGQRLTVTGLARGNWQVEVDGADAGSYAASELAKGVAVPGSALACGKIVPDLVARKQNNYFEAWRNVRLGTGGRSSAATIYEGLMALDGTYDRAIRDEVAAPRAYLVRLTPAPAGENLALHRRYVTSDENTFGWGVGGLTDGSWATDPAHCFATGAADKFPKSVTVDLETPARIGAVRLGVPDFGSTRHVKVSVSADGKDWAEVGTVEFAADKAARRTVNFAPVKARWVRLPYTAHWQETVRYPPLFVFTTECEVFGAQGR